MTPSTMSRPSTEPPSLRGLILWPALVTLAVTVLRLVGELQRWSPRYFNRDAGGGGALVGIVWLVPIFAVYFALRVAPPEASRGAALRSLGWALLAFFTTAILSIGGALLVGSPIGQLAIFTVTSWIGVMLARRAAPGLWRVLLAYGFAARLPVLVIMAASIFGGLDTHYAKPRPDFPPMGALGLFFWTALLPQLAVWIWVTVVGGLLFATLALLVARRQPV
jgi:hypothetical protein